VSCTDLLQRAVGGAHTVRRANKIHFDALATVVLPNSYALEAGVTVAIGKAQPVVAAYGPGSDPKHAVLADRRAARTHRVDACDSGAHEVARTLLGVDNVAVDVVAVAQIEPRPAAVILPMTGLVDAEAEAPRGDADVANVALRTVGGRVTWRAVVLALTVFVAEEAGRTVVAFGRWIAAGRDPQTLLRASRNGVAPVVRQVGAVVGCRVAGSA
jgi:hypothetical protein